jgi:LysM repeat protein
MSRHGFGLLIPGSGGGGLPYVDDPFAPLPDYNAGTPTPTPQQTRGAVYVVHAGDTLARIATRYGVTVQAIAQANRIANINLVRVGQRLVIPGGVGGSSDTSTGTGTGTKPDDGKPPAAHKTFWESLGLDKLTDNEKYAIAGGVGLLFLLLLMPRE